MTNRPCRPARCRVPVRSPRTGLSLGRQGRSPLVVPCAADGCVQRLPIEVGDRLATLHCLRAACQHPRTRLAGLEHRVASGAHHGRPSSSHYNLRRSHAEGRRRRTIAALTRPTAGNRARTRSSSERRGLARVAPSCCRTTADWAIARPVSAVRRVASSIARLASGFNSAGPGLAVYPCVTFRAAGGRWPCPRVRRPRSRHRRCVRRD